MDETTTPVVTETPAPAQAAPANNPVELITIGTKIAEIGTRLSKVRAERDELNYKVLALESELLPLITKHGELLTAIIGRAMPTPAVQVQQPMPMMPMPMPMMPTNLPAPGLAASSSMKQQVIEYLKMRHVDDTISATEIAESLHIDSAIVREAMLDLRNSRK
jgi:hypothetical protein